MAFTCDTGRKGSGASVRLAGERTSQGLLARSWRRFRRDRMAVLGAVID